MAGSHYTSVRTVVRSQIVQLPPGGPVGARPLKFSNRFTARYSIGPIELKLGMIILDNNVHNRYEQDFQVQGRGSEIQNFLWTSVVHVLFSRCRRNFSI